MIIAPSILSADFNYLLNDVKICEKAKAEFLHLDIMDGHFVPNISFGPVVIKNIRKETKMIFDVHLMIDDPDKYAIDFAKVGADIITFHYEAVKDVLFTIQNIKKLGVKAGLSLKPKTSINELKPFLPLLDLVLVMSVEPGFGGQEFMPEALNKIRVLSELKKQNNYSYLIEVDGGINYETAKECKKAGCEVIVAGSFIFKSSNKEEVIKELKKI